jgi:hypothetical protein
VGEEYQRRKEELGKKNRAIAFRRNQVEIDTCICMCLCVYLLMYVLMCVVFVFQSSNREEDRWKQIDDKKAQEKVS